MEVINFWVTKVKGQGHKKMSKFRESLSFNIGEISKIHISFKSESIFYQIDRDRQDDNLHHLTKFRLDLIQIADSAIFRS